jgi:membrane associated rhomboid family serine protease
MIAINVIVFFYFQNFGSNQMFTYTYSAVPAEILTGEDIVSDDRIVSDPISGDSFRIPGLQPTPIPVYLTIITSMFMHGGIAHLFGNMLFLFIFGDNIENRIGHFRYFTFYMFCGIIASLAHVFASKITGANLFIPTLGASGAISGVLGGYLMLFPTRRVVVLLFYFLTDVPALLAIGMWFVFQLISGIGVLGTGAQEGGVAYGAHIGGFIAGFLLIRFFAIGRKKFR